MSRRDTTHQHGSPEAEPAAINRKKAAAAVRLLMKTTTASRRRCAAGSLCAVQLWRLRAAHSSHSSRRHTMGGRLREEETKMRER